MPPHAVPCLPPSPFPLPFQVLLTAEETSPLSLANLAGTRTVSDRARFSSPRELLFTAFQELPRDVYYWVLPAPFAGDKVRAPGPAGGQGGHPQGRLSLAASRPAGDIVRW